jgi:hypothetical protein
MLEYKIYLNVWNETWITNNMIIPYSKSYNHLHPKSEVFRREWGHSNLYSYNKNLPYNKMKISQEAHYSSSYCKGKLAMKE